MLRHIAAKGLLRALAAFAVVVTALVAGGLTTTSSPFEAASETPYPASVKTTTRLGLEKSTMQPGESNTARARVSSGDGTPPGTVTFRVAGRAGQTVPLVNGEAAWELPRDLAPGRTYKVTARYNGVAADSGEALYQPSRDAAYVTVADGDIAGEEAEGDDDGAMRPATVAGDAGGLPNVGTDATTQVVALAGGLLLAAGGAFLLRHRRRSQV